MIVLAAACVLSLMISLAVIYHVGYLKGYHYAIIELSKTTRMNEENEIAKIDSERAAAVADYKRSTMGINVESPTIDPT